MAIKADLHYHPGGFWNPAERNAPIQPIIDKAIKRGIKLVTLTSCHDDRFTHYLRQAEQFSLFDFDGERRIFRLGIPGNPFTHYIYFLDGQEIKGSDGDVNIICPGKRMVYEPRIKSVEYLAKTARDLRALTSLPHAFGTDGLAVKTKEGQATSERLLENGLFDFIEVHNALMSRRGNEETFRWYEYQEEAITNRGYFGWANMPQALAVSDGHYDGDLGAAFTYLELPEIMPAIEVFDKLAIAEVSLLTKENFGYVSWLSKLQYRTSLVAEIAMRKLKLKK